VIRRNVKLLSAKGDWILPMHRSSLPTITVEGTRRDYGETRFQTVGFPVDRMVMVVWTPRNEARHVISMRKCNEREKAILARLDAHRITKAQYAEAPELTKEMLDRAEIRHGDKIIRRGRPPLENPKEAVKLRLDYDVLTAYRKTGRGWQTRINADLRKAARKLAG
jgi:uncharacterized protein (DUF4415 family)